MRSTSESRYAFHAGGALLVLVAAMYFSTGTMAPYAAMDTNPLVLEPCHYLANIDHYHFEAVFRMIGGEEPARWLGSVVLRRLLYPVLAYPFVQVFGVLLGGFIATVLLHAVAVLVFGAFVRRRVGETAAVAALWLLATYPGITYWAGLPYSYVAVVPGSLFALVLLYRIADAQRGGEVFRWSLLVGVIFTAYDLFPFFAPAVLLILIVQRRFRHLLPAAAGLVAPSIFVVLMFMAMGVPVLNSNTATYLTVAFSYLNFERYDAEWIASLLHLPVLFISNMLFSNMIVLPVLAALAVFVAWRRRAGVLELPDKAVLAAVIAVFLFNNAAPPYYGWQMRGEWVARLYQPVFVILLMMIARVTQSLSGEAMRAWQAAIVLAVAVNGSIAFGPFLGNPLAAYAYHKFYAHEPPETLFVNMDRFGRRPLGFCSDSHRWDRIPDSRTPYNRPPFMYRYPPR